MSLAIGSHLGPYEILAALGVGGMGEVYRATDSNLKRSVAIKVLPASVAGDADRLARFQREAEVLAALNHPNIAAIYGLEKTADLTALVMELVEGEDLSQRIARGAIPIDEALPIAKQIAEALEAAHEQGIIHRDLKPANIKVRSDGTVKVLDFGLAKAMEVPGSGFQVQGSAQLTNSPTLTSPALMTGAGTILGTAAYMSPEQARGKPVDKRADVWGFGCVLYEMLTGTRAFDGEEISDVLARILERAPDFTALPATTPPAIRRLLRRCLEKDRKQRLPDIGVARLEIDEALAAPSREAAPDGASLPAVAGPASIRRRTATLAAVVLATGIATGFVVWLAMRPGPAPARPVTRFTITPALTEQLLVTNNRQPVALSPDGTRLVYATSQGLSLRALDQLDATPIRGVEAGSWPFFSPDGQWIGFWQNGQIKKVAVSGGAPVALCVAAGNFSASWGSGDTIVFGLGAEGIARVSGAGGTPEVIVKVDVGQSAYGPQLLPGSRLVLFTLNTGGPWDRAQIVVQSLDTGKRQVVIQGGRDARYLPTGHLVYVTGNTLLAVPFDLTALKVTGGPVPLVENVRVPGGATTGGAFFSVSGTGSLVYVPGTRTEQSTLVWVDRQGREEPVAAEPRPYRYPRLSPDGARAAVAATDQDNDIWIWEFARPILTRLTFTPDAELSPLWSPDGRQVLFQSTRSNASNVYRQTADGTGTAERLTTGPNRQLPYAFSPDGKTLLFGEIDPKGQYDLRVMSMDGDRESKPLLSTPFNEQNADLSPDGRWMVYQSDQSGQEEIYVRPFPRMDDGIWQISAGGGSRPIWARSGREVFYLARNGAVMTVPVQTQSGFSRGNPAKLFDSSHLSPTVGRHYDVSPDGQRFLMIKQSAGPNDAPRFIVVLNWFEELKARVPTK